MRPLTITAWILLAVAGCDHDFEDDRQSLLKKPELLALVVDPPGWPAWKRDCRSSA